MSRPCWVSLPSVCCVKITWLSLAFCEKSELWCAARCVDKYVELRAKATDARESESIDPRLEAIVQRMFERSVPSEPPEQLCCSIAQH